MNSTSRKVDKNLRKQISIDAGLHRLLKLKAAKESTTIKTLVEGCLAELLAVDNQQNEQGS